jgi:glycosyltransferase involved in cell wall biosynthesis
LIISVGQIIPVKGYPDLILAFSEVVRAYLPNNRVEQTHNDDLDVVPALIIVGKGNPEYENKLRQMISELNLERHVFLLGQRSDVHQLLSISDIYVTASHSEGMPLSILEAMSAGIAIIATSVGDIPIVMGNEAGKLVPPQQTKILTKAILELLKDPMLSESYGKAAREIIKSKYNADIWLERLLSLYQEVCFEWKNKKKNVS